jgi:hypothetical protein
LLLTFTPKLLFTRRRNRRQLKLPLRIDLGHPSRNDIADLNVIVDLFDELFRQSADPDQPGRFGRNLDEGTERRDAGNDADHRVSRPQVARLGDLGHHDRWLTGRRHRLFAERIAEGLNDPVGAVRTDLPFANALVDRRGLGKRPANRRRRRGHFGRRCLRRRRLRRPSIAAGALDRGRYGFSRWGDFSRLARRRLFGNRDRYLGGFTAVRPFLQLGGEIALGIIPQINDIA